MKTVYVTFQMRVGEGAPTAMLRDGVRTMLRQFGMSALAQQSVTVNDNTATIPERSQRFPQERELNHDQHERS